MKTTLRILWILLCLALVLVASCWNVRDVFVQGHIYFVDGDCYARMTRARMIAEHPGLIVRHHDFENWPQGIVTHTTAPLDYLIVGLKGVLDVAFRLLDPHHSSILYDQTLDLAGALISPLLGLAGAIFLAWWMEKFRARFGLPALLFYAVCPIIVHGNLLGRPDHQSLLMTLFTVAFGAELALARSGEASVPSESARRWGIVSGLAWSLSLWVSLYEPTILLGVVLVLWLLFDRRALWSRSRLPGAVVFVAVLLLALFLEGWSVALPDAEMRAYFSNWERTIGELSHLSPALLFGWVGWMVLATPVLLFLASRRDRRALPLLIVLGVVLVLTIWQARWGYFLGIVFAWTLPWQMQALLEAWHAAVDLVARVLPWQMPTWRKMFRWSWAVWLLFVASLWPLLEDWDARLFPEDVVQDQLTLTRLFPEDPIQDQLTVKRAEMVALRALAVRAIGAQGGAFLAPWWLSPSIAYWSHQPGVAGTSHESLPGIVDTARFFLSDDMGSAAAILRKRRVRWVLADEAGREIDTSKTLLGVTAPHDSLAATLSDHPKDAPDFLREWKGPGAVLRDGLRFYRLYEVDDARLPP